MEELLPKDDDECAGLPSHLLLAVGARVMLRRNVDTVDGLVNGARGVIRGFEWDTTADNEGAMPSKVFVSFEGKSGRGNTIQWNGEAVVPIRPVTAEFYGRKGSTLQRRQLPLILSYAITIHKVQGLSLKRAVIDAGSSIFDDGMTYVALSRVQSLAGLFLISLDQSKITVSEEVRLEMARLEASEE